MHCHPGACRRVDTSLGAAIPCASSSLAVKRLTEGSFLSKTTADLTVAGVERARDNLTEARRELDMYATIAAHSAKAASQ